MGSLSSPPNLPHFHFSEETLKPGTAPWSATREAVRRALEEYGFFFVTYHKFTTDIHGSTFNAVQELFDGTSRETKMKNTYGNMPLEGYTWKFLDIPIHESLGIDDATTLEAARKFTDIMWPGGNGRFCNTLHSYAKLVEGVNQIVMRMIFESYGVDKYCDTFAKSTRYHLRMIKNRAPVGDEPNLALPGHTDKSFTTILQQHGYVNGLEVQMKNGDWIKVELSPSVLLVMAGDGLMAWSNDRIISTNHKVTIVEERYSTGLFSFSDGVIQVPDELVDADHPLKYKPFDHLGLLRHGKGLKDCSIKSYCGI